MDKPIKNIYLMGFMGCGKSLIGELLAQKLDWHFVDTDALIVEDAGMSINDIFAEKGESEFRRLEKECVKRVSLGKKQVISLGGGAVIDPENWQAISQSGITIAISFPSEIIAERLADVDDRPLINDSDDEERLQRINKLMVQREKHYKKADLVLHMNNELGPERIIQILLAYLGEAR